MLVFSQLRHTTGIKPGDHKDNMVIMVMVIIMVIIMVMIMVTCDEAPGPGVVEHYVLL